MQLLRFIQGEHDGDAGIVYCQSRKRVEEIAETLERDTFLAAEQAREFGILDEVIEKRAEAAEAEF